LPLQAVDPASVRGVKSLDDIKAAWPTTLPTFVVSMNLHRRHLNESQRAMIAARLANIKHGQVGRGHEKSESEISISEAASLLNVDRNSHHLKNQ
jgi:hypothetical protein